MERSIPNDSVFVMTSNVIGTQVIRKLRSLGFTPTRIEPKKTAKIPGKAKLIVVVPKAVSHGASDTALKWGRNGGGDVLFANNSSVLEREINKLGVRPQAAQTFEPITKIKWASFNTAVAFTTALIEENNELTVAGWEDILKEQGADGQRGTDRTTYYRSVKRWREANGLPPFSQAKWGERKKPRSANCMKGVTVDLSNATIEPEPPEPVKPEPKSRAPLQADAEVLAGLVWEWMDSMGYKSVGFMEDGSVVVTATPKATRKFSLQVVQKDPQDG